MYDYAVNHILLRAAGGGVMRGEVAGFMIFHLLPNLTHTHMYPIFLILALIYQIQLFCFIT